MKNEETQLEFALTLCKGNAAAVEFLCQAWTWFHRIDDLVDGDTKGNLAVVKTFAEGIVVLSHPFYLQNLAALRVTILNIAQLYALSVEWEGGAEAWQREWAEVQRHCGMQLALAVAMICGGWDHAQRMARTLAEESHKNC